MSLQFQHGGGGRTRTYEGVSQRIYSPPPLPLGTLPQMEPRTSQAPPACAIWSAVKSQSIENDLRRDRPLSLDHGCNVNKEGP